MPPKKTPRPKARKSKNRLSRRSAAKTDTSYIVPSTSQQTCLNCRYWNMWDHSCATRAVALEDFSPVNPDTPACKEFQPE